MVKTDLNDFDDGAHDGGGRPFRVMPLCDDPIEELTSLAELHHEVDSDIVFIGVLQAHHVWVTRQVPHDLHLPPHVLDVHGGAQLLLGDGLAGEALARVHIGAEVCDAELASAELLPKLIATTEVPAGEIPEDDEGRGRPAVVIDREGVRTLLLAALPPRPLLLWIGGSSAAVTHCESGDPPDSKSHLLEIPTRRNRRIRRRQRKDATLGRIS